ncbi:MAG: hypothetical protein QOJ23_1696 [Actinomycetota bacterium]|nr:hypothetical protein [Actinomycetota bacterium]
MKTKAAVLWELGKNWEVVELDVDPPKQGEVLIRFVAAGLCHSDEHLRHGDIVPRFPLVGGHEGAGIIEEVGPGVSRVKVGDHVVCSFIPSCGFCRWCSTGQQNLCDLGATILEGCMPDGTFRFHSGDNDLGGMCMLGTFSQWATISETSCVRVDDDFNLETAVLVGCGVPTGWGSAVYAADIRPGDAVAVAGVGGIGGAAIQGAKLAGAKVIIAIEPVAAKKDLALQLGATHVATSWEEAPGLVAEATWHRGVDKFICAMGVGDGHLMRPILSMTAKRGKVVVTNIHRADEVTIDISLHELTLTEKQIVGTLYGSANARADIPKMLELSSLGLVDLDVMITNTYGLQDVNQGYADLRAGVNLRGVLLYPPPDDPAGAPAGSVA